MLAVARREAVTQEEHVEPGPFSGGGDVLHQAEVGPAVDDGRRMPPTADVVSGRLHEDAETHMATLCQEGPQ